MTDKIPIYIFHTVPMTNEFLQRISSLIQDDKVVFEPAYFKKPDGTIELKHISINPRYNKCKDDSF